MTKRPNILLIITDQQRADHAGFGGNQVLKTPNLDLLASRAMCFDRAYVANPMCMPNRASIFTGRLPSSHGVRHNGIPLNRRAETFVRQLAEVGYATAQIGKCHLQPHGIGRDIARRYLADLPPKDATALELPPGWDRQEDRHAELPEPSAISNYYGFDHNDLVMGHGDLCYGHYERWVKSQGHDIKNLAGPANRLPNGPTTHQSWRTAVPEELYSTTYIAKQTERYLLDRAADADQRPFFLVSSFPDPHHPFTPPGRYFDLYQPADIPLPETFYEAHEGSMPQYRRSLAARGTEHRSMASPFSPTEQEFREMAAREYGSVTMIDDATGRILAALERADLADNTVVVFTSDHGDMFGDHGMMFKGAMHYQQCIQVPFLISVPGMTAGRTGGLACSTDLAPTLLALAGVGGYHGMQGVDLRPVLADPLCSVRDDVLIEEDELQDILGIGCPVRMRTVQTRQARLTVCQGIEGGELFDLENDPLETRNLFEDPSGRALRAEMFERLSRAVIRADDVCPRPVSYA